MKKYTLRMPDDLAEKLKVAGIKEKFFEDKPEEAGDRKGTYGMNKFLCTILANFVEHGWFHAQAIPSSPAASKLDLLLQKQTEFESKLEFLLKEAAAHPTVESEESKAASVLQLISRQSRLKFSEIQAITRIPENELLILLGHLYAESKIAYDETWRYYRI